MLAESFNPDVILVDLEMPAPHGGSVFDIVRSKSEAYLIGIAPADADTVRIRALRAGADDVVSVPVSPEELAARCQALLRRPRNLHTRWDPMAASVIALGPLSVDVGRKEIQVHGQDVPVTRIEFALFEQLCRHPAEVRSRIQLLEEVWGPNWVGDTHVVDVHLSNLRRKLQRLAPDLRFIHTVRGVGFRLSTDLLRSGGAADSDERDLIPA
jgi:two-component system OmpR family response regulator